MDAAADRGAFAEAGVFLSYFDDLPDPRQRGKVVYPLDEVLVLALLAVLAGAETFVDIARFGAKKLTLLRRFRPFRDGTPSHDHLGGIFAAVDAEAFQRCFVAWVASLVGTPAEVIAIDGKTSRRSGQKTSGKAPIHMVSAFAARQRLVLGHVKVAEKSNEIVAVPKLLDLMAIEGAVVTIDARPHRDPDHHRPARCLLVAGAPRLARLERRRHRRQHPRDRPHNRTGDAALHHVAEPASQKPGRDRAKPLGRREQPALGHGHGLP